jgi:hypothetical protein
MQDCPLPAILRFASQEAAMPLRDNLVDRPMTAASDNLLACRMAMLGLDFDAIARADRAILAEIRRRCAACDTRDACAVDLQRDPNNPVWESYCPNAPVFNALTATWWLPQ